MNGTGFGRDVPKFPAPLIVTTPDRFSTTILLYHIYYKMCGDTMPRGKLLDGQLYCEVFTEYIVEKLEEHADRYKDSFELLLKAWAEDDETYQEDYRQYSLRFAERTLPEGTPQPRPPQKPVNRGKTYQKWIGFFDDTLDNEITLTSQEYSQYILDNWDFIVSHIQQLRALSISANTFSSDSLMALTMYDT